MALLACLLMGLSASAYDFMVNGLCYNRNIDSTTVSVTYQKSPSSSFSSYSDLSGNLVIPESVTLGGTTYSVTSIGQNAFECCFRLASVAIPNSVTSIGYQAFYGCSGLTSVTIGNSVTSIGNEAFRHCSGLTSVTIPNSVTSIGDYAFSGCSGLTSVTIGNSVTSIGDYAFSGCSGLESMVVTSGNSKYDSRNNCNAIIETVSNTLIAGCKTTTIGNSVTSIGNSAFFGCSGLTSVTIGNSVTSIGYSAFYGCSGLTSVTIPNSVISIGNSAFFGCSGLTSVTIPNSVTKIGGTAFSSCSGLTSVTWNAKSCADFTSTMTPFSSAKTSIKNFVFGDEVEKIPANLCYQLTGLASVTIPNSVTSIGGSAFYGCSGLTSVTIPNSVTSIGNEAFYGCSGLTSVTIPNSVTSIGYCAFKNCRGLTEVTIGNSVTSIGGGAFDGCTGLTSVTIPNSVTSIGYYAFRGCSGLTSVTIPNSVTSIGWSAFDGCRGLTSVTIPNSVTSIGSSAFDGCTGLTSVTWNAKSCADFTSTTTPFSSPSIKTFTFGDEVEKIPAYLCYQLTGLTSVAISNSVTKIGSSAFDGCTGLTSVTIGNSVTSIVDGAFRNCSGLTSVTWNAKSCADFTSTTSPFSSPSIKTFTFGDEVEKIPAYLCYQLTGLTSVAISNSVTYIAGTAFDGTAWYNNQLDGLVYAGLNAYKYKGTMPSGTSIEIQEGTKSISSFCFMNCSGLTSVTIPNSVTSIGESAFSGCSGLADIFSEIANPTTRTVASDAFSSAIYPTCTLHVPAETKHMYQVTSPWNNFENIVEGEGKHLCDVNGDGVVDIFDVNAVINKMLGKNTEIAADVNGDGVVDIFDVNEVVNVMLGRSTGPGTTTYTVGGVSFTMVAVQGGTFTMGATPEQGSDAASSEKPAHQVMLSGYSIGQTEVTQELWQAVMGSNPSSFIGNLQCPVEQVSWSDCQTFISKLNQMTGKNFRLPTEAEWEYAARGGNRSQGYKYAGSNTIGDVAWYYDNSYALGSSNPDYGTHIVATKAPNELGLYDMSGNVWEWCQDWYGSYSSDAQTNPTGPASGSNRVRRGGSWGNYARGCRVSFRFNDTPSYTNFDLGLRLAL